MKNFVDSINEKLKLYHLSDAEVQQIKIYIQQNFDLKDYSNTNVEDIIKSASKKLNINLVKKYKNITKLEYYSNRITIFALSVIIILAILNVYFQVVQSTFYFIILGLITLVIFNIADRNYYLSSVFGFVGVLTVFPIIKGFSNVYISIIFICLLIITLFYLVFTFRKKSKTYDDQTHLYQITDYEHNENYFSQKLGEKTIVLRDCEINEYYFDNSLGKFNVDTRKLTKKDYIFHIRNEFAEFNIIVNKNYNYDTQIKSVIGEVKYLPKYNENIDKKIIIKGVNNIGYVYFITSEH